jgi:hypothetical protein
VKRKGMERKRMEVMAWNVSDEINGWSGMERNGGSDGGWNGSDGCGM